MLPCCCLLLLLLVVGELLVGGHGHPDEDAAQLTLAQEHSHSNVKREADYTLDESFWIDESPTGEVERLLREYTQNQEMVKNIGSHYYQIIYPVQLRQHKKMGISTREIASKVRKTRSTRGQGDGSFQQSRPRPTKTGKHFHRTSLLIKAFDHKFRLDLELNTQLVAPNIMQKHFLANGAEQVSKQEIEQCYYHGTVQGFPGATAAFHTCNGVSGVIHLGNETFVIHPFYGGDLSKHPHVIFEARTKASKGCANTGNMEYRLTPHSGFLPSPLRIKRDIREVTKFIEIALIIDKAMFEKRNGSTRIDVVQDTIQVANIADLYFRTLNTRVSVVYMETWQGGNQVQIDRKSDISRALSNLNDYASRKLFHVVRDTTQLLTGEEFESGEAGMAVPATLCTPKAVAISVDINTYEPHLLAGTMAHMIGHNIGMGHDDGREECRCMDWHGCIMAQSIVGLENIQPYKFSDCSRSDYMDMLRTGKALCLLNKPNMVDNVRKRSCGNKIVEEDEDCDCGGLECDNNVDPCCDPVTCKLKKEAECASGPCCHKCKLRPKNYTCRESSNECDLPEKCNGETGDCPPDVFKKNGRNCSLDNVPAGRCFQGFCPTLDEQCMHIWGFGASDSAEECFKQFNAQGTPNGHCGDDYSGKLVACAKTNVKCGSLHCQGGDRSPTINGLKEQFASTIISIKGQEYTCKTTTSNANQIGLPKLGLVRDGTPCGDNLICLNQTCTSIHPYIDQRKCPESRGEECSGRGECDNLNRCHCDKGWQGPDCSIKVEEKPEDVLPTVPPHEINDSTNITQKMKKKETPYEDYHGSNTIFLVGTLMSVVGGVFIVFATMALCYRSVVVHKNFSLCLRRTTVHKYEKAYKKPISKNYVHASGNHSQESTLESNRILGLTGSVQSIGRADSQRVLFRSSNHMGAGGSQHFQEQNMQKMKRLPIGASSEDDQVEDETVSFIDLQHNNLKLPEKKGILKKHDYGMMLSDLKDSWANGAQTEDLMNQAEANIAQLMSGQGSTDVERTLKTLNGYHEDIIKALRNAASRRSTSIPSGSTSELNEERLRRSLQQCAESFSDYKRSSQEKVMQADDEDEDEDEVPPCGPIRIRNLEDLIRQLEHHSRHMSPSGSEDIRLSETEADRHYRGGQESSCSESSHQSHTRDGVRGDRFMYGRHRYPPARLPYPPMHQTDEDSIYESADHDRGATCHDTPDSESDDFIHAQQQLARWASEDGVGAPGPSGGVTVHTGGSGSGMPGLPLPREYFPSPSSSTSEEPPSIARAPVPAPCPPPGPPHPDHATIHRPKRYPEYKH